MRYHKNKTTEVPLWTCKDNQSSPVLNGNAVKKEAHCQLNKFPRYEQQICICCATHSTSCKKLIYKLFFFFSKAVKKEINSSHCHLMSCRELPVTMLPHIPLFMEKNLTLFNYFASVCHPVSTSCTWKPASRNLSYTKQHASHKAVLLFIAHWEVIDALSVDSFCWKKSKRTLYESFFQGRLVYWTLGHGKGDKNHLYKGCVSPQQWR